MALIKSVRGFTPVFGKNIYLAETAIVIGDVVTGDDCSVWFNAVVRGDVNSIRMGNRVNIQDGAIIHCTYQKASTTIGNNVSIGHNDPSQSRPYLQAHYLQACSHAQLHYVR